MQTRRPLIATLTVRKTVRFVTTLRVYEATQPTPPKPVIVTTGEAVEELPSRPGLAKAEPIKSNVIRFPKVG